MFDIIVSVELVPHNACPVSAASDSGFISSQSSAHAQHDKYVTLTIRSLTIIETSNSQQSGTNFLQSAAQ